MLSALLFSPFALPRPSQASPPPRPAPAAPADVAVHENLAYAATADERQKLDLAIPASGDGPFPAVVCIHGGGWRAGSRKQYGDAIRNLARQGWVGVTAGYRLAPKHPFPAQIHDVKCAIRWLRANAVRYKVDPGRIGAVGDSAGGHLAAMLGTTGPEDGFEGDGGHADRPSRVGAVVAFYGCFDLEAEYRYGLRAEPPALSAFIKTTAVCFLGGTPEEAGKAYRAASPGTYATPDDAPTLLLHGTKDALVPIAQSERYAERLKKTGVPVELVRIEGAGHGFGGKDLEQALAETMRFFDRHLRRR